MLAALDSYKPHEWPEVSFLTTYIKVIKLVAEQQWLVSKMGAIKSMASRSKIVDEGYQERQISVSEFTNFYNVLAWYYKEIEDNVKSTRCHTHILTTIHRQLTHCSPDCDYRSVSIAYDNINDRMQAFDFRQLAYQYQLHSLDGMEHAKLILDLYNDYSNTSVGNDTTEAQTFSATITDDIYPYLMTANKSEYLEETYYVAIEFFRAKNMEKQVVQLQNRMIYNAVLCTESNCIVSLKRGNNFNGIKVSKNYLITEEQPSLMNRCDFICAAHYAEQAQEAYDRECYHLAIWAGEQSCACIDKLGEPYTVLKFKPEYIIATSYYKMGNNHSATRIYLKHALEHINTAIRFKYFSWELRSSRAILSCYSILVNRLLSNPLHYIYILKDIIGFWAVVFPLRVLVAAVHHLSEGLGLHAKEVVMSVETGLTNNFLQQKNNFLRSQFDILYNYSLIAWKILVLVIYSVYCCVIWFHYYTVPFRWIFRTRFRTLLCILILILLFLSDWV